MKKSILTILSIITLILASCTSEEPLNANHHENLPQESYFVPIPEALSKANSLMNALDAKSPSTRSSSSSRSVESIDVFKSKTLTRSETSILPDTLFYIINYTDNSGFAIVSADRRTRSIYAISTDGDFNIKDTVFNKSLAHFFENMEADMHHSISKVRPYQPIDTIINPGTDIGTKTENIVGPYLSKSQADWNQKYPFNKFCFDSNGKSALVGCVAVAAGQIMSYYRHPDNYNSHEYNWDLINSDHFCNELAYLLSDLGREENLDMYYSPTSSSASLNRLDPTFYNMGYEHCGYGTYFTHEAIKKYLKSGPVYFSGYRYDNDGTSSGHAFVCDGYIEYLTTVAYPDTDILYHCIWGWKGHGNGYYYWTDGFDLNNPIKLDPDEPTGSIDRFYNHRLRIWGDFKIRK